MAQFASQVQFGIESRRTAPSSHRTCGEHREAIEVFLKFLKTFSSEKVFKPRGSDWSEATTHGEAVQNAIASAKGVWGKTRVFPQRLCWIYPTQTCELVKKKLSFDCGGAVKRNALVKKCGLSRSSQTVRVGESPPYSQIKQLVYLRLL